MHELPNSITADSVLNVQVAPIGEFSGVLRSPDGSEKPIVQHLDAAVLNSLVDAWRAAGSPELLVDADHKSMNGGSSLAFAWASNLSVEADGLHADFKFTPKGAEAVSGREYRFVSPVFNFSPDGTKIVELHNIALCNNPNLPVRCVLNRAADGFQPVEVNKDNPNMDKLKETLGLPPDATDEQVLEAVAALKKAKADADAAALNSEAERCADEHKDRVENREEFVKLYVKNGKETALAFLAALKKPEAPKQVVLNSTAAAKPGLPVAKNSREELAALPIAERAKFYKEHQADFT